MTIWILFSATTAFLLAWMGTGWVRRYALARQMVDIPNERSSHTVATPRGGGLAIVVAVLLLCFVATAIGALDADHILAFAPALFLVAVAGFWDDHYPVSPAVRLLMHLVAVVWVVFWLGAGVRLEWPSGGVLEGPVMTLLAVLAMVWFLNLFNFMDGIDGIAGSEAAFLAVCGGALSIADGRFGLALVFAAVAGSALGFLRWNWTPARIFMGDVGSGFLGAALAMLAYALSTGGNSTLWVWIILSGVFVVDATTTLLLRMLRGEQWYKPHRSHAYQHAARRWGHQRVVLGVLAIDIAWLLPLAIFALWHPGTGAIIVVVAYLPLLIAAIAMGAGRKEDDGQQR